MTESRPTNALAPQRVRIDWIDRLKGFAFFFVILGHLPLQGLLKLGPYVLRLAVFKSWIYSFHMPLFFFVTGFTYNIDKLAQTKPTAYLSKLVRRMLIPYLWMELLSILIHYAIARAGGKNDVPLKQFLLGILVGNNHLYNAPSNPLYFILLLFLAEVLLFCIVKLARGNRTLIWTVVLLLLPGTLLTQRVVVIWHANVVPGVMFMILLGTLLRSAYRQHESFICRLHPLLKLLLCGLMLCAGWMIWHSNGRIGLHGNVWGKDFTLAMLSALASTVGFSFAMMALPSKEWLLSYAGKNTLFFMGLHKPVLLLLTALWPAQARKDHNVRFILIAAVICYLGLTLLTLLLERTAPFLLGKATVKDNVPNRLGQILCIVGATCIPYRYVYTHNIFWNVSFKGSILLSGTLRCVVACAVYAVLCVGCFFLLRALRFPFLMEKEKNHG